ncbi:hypothetical protein CALVIDRAFT_523300, partial [Calocera viscosa TUFC12733]
MSPVKIKRPPPESQSQPPPKRFRSDIVNPFDVASTRVPAPLPPKPQFAPKISSSSLSIKGAAPLLRNAAPSQPRPPPSAPIDSEPEEGELDDVPLPPPSAPPVVPKPPSDPAPTLPPPPSSEEPKSAVKFFPFKMKNKGPAVPVLDKGLDLTAAPLIKPKIEGKGKEREEGETTGRSKEHGAEGEDDRKTGGWDRSPPRHAHDDDHGGRRAPRPVKRDTWVPSPEERSFDSWRAPEYRPRSPRSPRYRP